MTKCDLALGMDHDNSVTYHFPSVMSPLCALPPDTSSAPLKTMQAMSHKQPVDLPIGLDHGEVDDEDISVPSSGPQLISHVTIRSQH